MVQTPAITRTPRRLEFRWIKSPAAENAASKKPTMKSNLPIMCAWLVKPMHKLLSKLFIMGLFLWSNPLFATVTIGDTTHDFNSGAVSTASSTAKDHAAGNAILVSCSSYSPSGNTVSSVANTAGDIFTGQAGAKRTSAIGPRLEIFYVLSSAGNASDVVTCTWSSAVLSPTIVTVEVIHTGALTFDIASTSTAEANGTAHPVQQFSSSAIGILFYASQDDAGTTTTPPASPAFTTTGNNAYGASYRLTAGAETNITPSATRDSATNWVAVTISITESAVGRAGRSLLLGVGP